MFCDGKITNADFYKTRDQIAATEGLSLRTRKTGVGGMAMKRPAAAAEPEVPAKRAARLTDAEIPAAAEIPTAAEIPMKRPSAATTHGDDDEEDDLKAADTDSGSELGMGDQPADESYFDFSNF